MYQETIEDMLVTAQGECYNAQTKQIIDLVNDHNVDSEVVDEAIKLLVDERRRVWNEFAKRIEALDTSQK